MKEILERLKTLIIKLIGVKGLVFITCSVFLGLGKITPIIWAVFATIIVGVRAVEKAVRAWNPPLEKDNQIEGFSDNSDTVEIIQE